MEIIVRMRLESFWKALDVIVSELENRNYLNELHCINLNKS